MTVLLRTATSPTPSLAAFTMRTSIPGSGLPTVSARNGFRSLTVIAVTVRDRNSQIIEKLQRLRLSERATHDDGSQLATKCFVDLFQQRAADAKPWPALRQFFVDGYECVKQFALACRQSVEASLQTFLQILQNQRNKAHIGNLVPQKSFAHILGPQRAQMHDSCATGKRPEKSHHKIDGMVCWQNAEVAHSRPERVERSQRNALL